MLTTLIHPLARYNFWANQQLIIQLKTLTDEQLEQYLTSSFPSIVKTVAHIHGAEDVWRQRLSKIVPATFYKLSDNASGIDELNKWIEATRKFRDEILSYNHETLNEIVSYVNIKGEPFGSPRWQMVQHAVNHSSYHRGQLVTMMRQVGMTTIPSTDLILYYRTVEDLVKSTQ